MSIHFSLIIGGGLTLLHIVFVACLLRRMNPSRVSPMLIHLFSALVLFVLLGVLDLLKIGIQCELVFSILLFGVAGYFFVFGAVYKSLSLRFLLVTHEHKGQISFAQLNELITQKTFSDRVIILQKMGLIEQEKEGFRLSIRGLQHLRKIIMIRKCFGIKTSGLYCQGVKQSDSQCSI